MKTLAPGMDWPAVLTMRPTRFGPMGENAGVLGGNGESGGSPGTFAFEGSAAPD